MRTSKPLSTISYNSPAFLNARLDDLLRRRVIEFYAWIEHFPEDDETKKHKHLYVQPTKAVETSTFFDEFHEIDPAKPDKPLGCVAPRPSKWQDWYLYAIHHQAYLTTKAQARKYHYDDSEVVVSDPDYFSELKHTMDMSKYDRQEKFVKRTAEGASMAEMIVEGVVPIMHSNAYYTAYMALRQDQTYRNHRVTHQAELFKELEQAEQLHEERRNDLYNEPCPFDVPDQYRINDDGEIIT